MIQIIKIKKSVLAIGCMLVLFLTGCAAAAEETDTINTNNSQDIETAAETQKDNTIYEITEKRFIEKCNDVYLNTDEYLDKIIKLEGLYHVQEDTVEDVIRHYVIRYGPGCCADDSSAGFEIRYDGSYPELNDWIEVTAIVEKIQRNGNDFVALKVISLDVLDERGAEQVPN